MLQRLYAATQDELLNTVEDLLDTAQFSVEQRQAVQDATQHMSRQRVKVGFTDLLIVAIGKAKGCTQTVSFDKVAVRSAGMTLLV